MARSKKVIIYRHHDRHIDDTILVIPYNQKNWELAKKRCQNDWCKDTKGFSCTGDGYEMDDKGDVDYAWGWSDATVANDSYYSCLKIVDHARTISIKGI